MPVYLDYNATTPCDPRVVEEMLPYFSQHFGNAASRTHQYGWEAAEAVNIARERVAQLIGAEKEEIVFTSGATEADNLALKGVFDLYAAKGKHIITCVTEHKAVLDTCQHLEKMGAQVTYLPVNASGLIDVAELEAALTPETIMVCLMYANNETGVIQPIREINQVARRHGVLVMTDATQAVGKVPVNVNRDGIDLMAFSAHKFYGPKGVGALFVRRKSPRVRISPQIDGGGHERGLRSGTLNVPGIIGFGKACELARLEMETEAARLTALRNHFEAALLGMEATGLNGASDRRLPQVSNISFGHVEGDALLTALNQQLAVSSGSACTSASMDPSHVLKAMGLSDELAFASLRFSFGRFTTGEEVDLAIQIVQETVAKVREISPLWEMYKEGAHH